MNLNEQQKKAIEHFKGPCLVIGTPGSGKTRVITERVRYLVEEKGVKNTNILVITFTKAAAVQMKKRYESMMGDASKRVYFGTFHAIFFTILKYAYHYTADNIIRDDTKRQILKELINKEDIEIQDENDFLNDIEGEISRVKGEMIELQHYYSPNCPGESFRRIFTGYQKALQGRKLIDFDDMLVYCYELLKAREDIRQMWHKQYPYILIDEFQDINKVQYDIVKMLAAPENNLFIVGDDDQSIYGFRGAKPDIMKQFLKDYKDSKRYVLGINYRCSGAIVERAAKLIEKNEKLGKKLFITGKGRCNFTNAGDEDDIKNSVVTNPKFMYSSFKGFSNYDVMGFFDELGLKFKIERGNRCFPESDHSSDVIGTLARELRKCKVDIMLSTEVVDVTARELSENVVSENAVSGKIVSCNAVSENIANDSVKLEKKYKSKKKEPKSKKKEPEYISQFVSVEVKELSTGRKQVIKADSCIIATGGNSYSSTGSTGDGYRFAKALSHNVTPIIPALVPLTVREE